MLKHMRDCIADGECFVDFFSTVTPPMINLWQNNYFAPQCTKYSSLWKVQIFYDDTLYLLIDNLAEFLNN